MDDGIELADMIWQLRHELSRAMWAGEHADLKFRAESIELNVSVAVERSREHGGAIKFWVLDGNAAAKRTATTTQSIRLVLQPFTVAAPDRPAEISGAALPDER